jgi:hypothetical protein
MTRKFALSLMCLAALVFTGSIAQAAITPGNLVGGVINELEDDDFDLHINAGGTIAAPGADTSLDVGDYLAAIVRITAIRIPLGGAQVATATDVERTFTAVVLQKIATRVINAGGVQDGNNDVAFTFAPATAAEWTALGFGALQTPSNDTTFAIVFDDPDNINQLAATAALAIATVNGTKLWELGFVAPPGPEFWVANTDTASTATAFGITNGNFSAALNVTGQFAGVQLAPFIPPGGVALAQVHLRNGSFGSATVAGPFPVSSDVDVLIVPIPEPASMVVWAGLMAGAGVWVRSRRRVK